ncbi:transcription termination/antitermination NusG family protein [Prevotella sp.]|uniref:transcription termination/antitermination NusG family protein n=1 Tax=Prevotella sp. TaxID=59823 RepID=UPI0025801207|nr:transcription termination/antitermination NusG family protein [Prevotella sp.]
MDSNTPMHVKSPTVTPTDGAVGVPKTARNGKHWYIAVVNNNSEKLCCERLLARIASQPDSEKDYEVYVAAQKEMRTWRNGRRKLVERIIFPTLVFIRCTDLMRRKEIVFLPYIKRFMVNIAGSPENGHRPVAVIPDQQMRSLMRMVSDAESDVTIDPRPLRRGEKVRVNGGKLMGLEGYVLQCPDNSTSLVIDIGILGSAKVNISRDLLDPIE